MSANPFYSLLNKFTSVGKASFGEAIKGPSIMLTGKLPVARKELRILQIHLKQVSTTYNWNEVVMMNNSNVILSPTHHSIDSMSQYFQHRLQLTIAEGDLVFLQSLQTFGLHALSLLGTDLRSAVLETLGPRANDLQTDIYDGLTILLEALRRCGISGETHQAIVRDVETSLSAASILHLMIKSKSVIQAFNDSLSDLIREADSFSIVPPRLLESMIDAYLRVPVYGFRLYMNSVSESVPWFAIPYLDT